MQEDVLKYCQQSHQYGMFEKFYDEKKKTYIIPYSTNPDDFKKFLEKNPDANAWSVHDPKTNQSNWINLQRLPNYKLEKISHLIKTDIKNTLNRITKANPNIQFIKNNNLNGEDGMYIVSHTNAHNFGHQMFTRRFNNNASAIFIPHEWNDNPYQYWSEKPHEQIKKFMNKQFDHEGLHALGIACHPHEDLEIQKKLKNSQYQCEDSRMIYSSYCGYPIMSIGQWNETLPDIDSKMLKELYQDKNNVISPITLVVTGLLIGVTGSYYFYKKHKNQIKKD